MTDDAPAPPTVRIYLPPMESAAQQPNREAINKAQTTPPTGRLDGWRAVDVDEDTWDSFENHRHSVIMHRDRMAAAEVARDRFLAKLIEQVGRG